MELANKAIRQAARAAKVPLWMVANELGISEPSMTRKLRMELTVTEQMKILLLIEEIAQSRKEAGA